MTPLLNARLEVVREAQDMGLYKLFHLLMHHISPNGERKVPAHDPELAKKAATIIIARD